MSKKEIEEKEVIETEVEEILEEPVEIEEKEVKKPFWKSKKFFVGLGVLGGAAIVALGMLGINKTAEIPYYALNESDFLDEGGNHLDNEDDESTSNNSSEENSEE